VFCHNNIRDILGHSARAAGLEAVVIEKIDGSKANLATSQFSSTIVALSSAFDHHLSPIAEKIY